MYDFIVYSLFISFSVNLEAMEQLSSNPELVTQATEAMKNMSPEEPQVLKYRAMKTLPVSCIDHHILLSIIIVV